MGCWRLRGWEDESEWLLTWETHGERKLRTGAKKINKKIGFNKITQTETRARSRKYEMTHKSIFVHLFQ